MPMQPCTTGEILTRWTAPVSHTFDVCNRTDLLKWHLRCIVLRHVVVQGLACPDFLILPPSTYENWSVRNDKTRPSPCCTGSFL